MEKVFLCGLFLTFLPGRNDRNMAEISIALWPLKESDYPLVSPRVFCDVNGGNRIHNASLDHAVESAIRFCTVKMNVIFRQ